MGLLAGVFQEPLHVLVDEIWLGLEVVEEVLERVHATVLHFFNVNGARFIIFAMEEYDRWIVQLK